MDPQHWPKQTLLIEYLLYGQAIARQVENNCVVAWIEEAEDMARWAVFIFAIFLSLRNEKTKPTMRLKSILH